MKKEKVAFRSHCELQIRLSTQPGRSCNIFKRLLSLKPSQFELSVSEAGFEIFRMDSCFDEFGRMQVPGRCIALSKL